MKKISKIGVGFKVLLLVILILVLGIGALVATAKYLNNGKIKTFQRLDNQGTLYYCEYEGNYDHEVQKVLPQLIGKFACSAFITDNEYGQKLTCRNFDYVHQASSGKPTALNVICKCKPEHGYSSINMIDAAILKIIGLDFEEGSLDNYDSNTFPLGYLPYMCMDGMNEKGLTCSILQLDTKSGESIPEQNDSNKPTYCIVEMLRNILDTCATVEEAENFISNANYTSILGTSYHLFITDAQGQSTVAEWRNNTYTSTHNDAVTNFYVNSDDACDVYKKDGTLKEKYVEPVSKYRTYRYGYGHGYDRFSKVIQTLDDHRTNAEMPTKMTNDEALNTLASVAQLPKENEKTSNTLYSIIYNNTDKTIKVANFRDFSNIYSFSLD